MNVPATIAALEAAEATTARLEKIAALKTADQDLLKQIFYMTYNPFLVYRQTVPGKVEPSDDRPESSHPEFRAAQWLKFFSLLEQAARGSRPDFRAFLALQHLDDAKWMTRVLNRDLKAGVAVSTMEVLFGKRCIPSFEVQLAESWEKMRSFPRRAYIEPKYDGLRGIAFKRNGGPWEFLSRAGKPFWNTELVAQELDSLGASDIVFDGEFFGEDWNDTQSVLKTQFPPKDKTAFEVKKQKLVFWVFDAIPLRDWEAGVCKLTQAERVETLSQLLRSGLKHVKQPPRYTVLRPEEALAKAKEWLDAGLEGAILKDLDARYTWTRSQAWVKIKFVKEADLRITGVRMGEGRLEGVIGALEGVDSEGNRYAVGTGFSDSDRVYLTTLHLRGELVGKIAECRPQDVGKGWKGSGRIAVFHRLREDKEGLPSPT